MISFEQPPTLGTLTQGYHEEHPAYDFGCVTGTPVYAVHSGELSSDYNGRMGNIALLNTTVVHPPTLTFKWYFHLVGMREVK